MVHKDFGLRHIYTYMCIEAASHRGIYLTSHPTSHIFTYHLLPGTPSASVAVCISGPIVRVRCIRLKCCNCSKCRAFTPLGLALRWNHVAYVIVRVMFICCGFIIKPLGVSDSFTYLPNGWCLVTS